MAKVKKTFSPEFENYISRHFPEHARHVLSAKNNATLVRFLYPFFSFFVPALCFGFLFICLFVFKDFLIAHAQGSRFSDFINNNSLTNTLIVIAAIGIFCSGISFLVGLSSGFKRARELLFQAEQLELNVRQLWFLEKTQEKKTIAEDTDFYEPGI